MNRNLPVLLLRGVVLFPYNEIRIEFSSIEEKQLLSLSEVYYNNQVFVVVPNDFLESDPEVDDLPNVGIVAEIKLKMDMPNGKTRIVLEGKNRGIVKSYLKEEELFEAEIEVIKEEIEDSKKELAYNRTLIKELDRYIKEVPYMSNGVLTEIMGITKLSRLVDIIAVHFPSGNFRKRDYLLEIDPFKRADMLLDDMNQDIEIVKLEQSIENKLQKELEENQKQFVLREKIRIIKEELGDINDKDHEIDILKKKVEELNANEKIKKRLIEEINRYEAMNPNSPEMGTIKGYIDTMLKLPWGTYTEDVSDLREVKKSLDTTHYGLDFVKDRIIEYLAVKQNTNNLRSPIICLVGPPGVGKTTLAKSIAKALGRKCTKISVGGINDEAEIVGHRRTYIGSAPGLIIQGMKKAGSNNPVFIIDEIDKMTKDIKGDPASSLLEVLDPEQNKAFMDHYLEEEYDLSKVMFITTANYLYQIPEALRDRLEIVELSSYTEYEKQDIALNYLIPRGLIEHGLTNDDVVFTKEVILTIIRNYTKEAGVRNLSRAVSSILRKVVKGKLVGDITEQVIIDNYNLEKYLGKKKFSYNDADVLGTYGVVNGLAYTEFGGDILPIEVTCYPGHGNLILTGSLGDVMKESATLALSYIKSHADEFNIVYAKLEKYDFHLHVPEGAVPKDGPSAGIAITSALISLLKEIKVNTNIGMTGEITLRGKVLPIGGLKEKVIGAHRGGIRKIFLPRINEKDLEEIPEEIRRDITFIFVDRYLDVYKELFNKFKRKRDLNESINVQLTLD